MYSILKMQQESHQYTSNRPEMPIALGMLVFWAVLGPAAV